LKIYDIIESNALIILVVVLFTFFLITAAVVFQNTKISHDCNAYYQRCEIITPIYKQLCLYNIYSQSPILNYSMPFNDSIGR